MSVGICAYAHLIDQDETMLIYSYGCYNVNHADWREMKDKEDGEIYINRDAFIEPEIHEKLKRMASGRKKLIRKRIRKIISPSDLFESGLFSVKNASGTWKINQDGIDFMAYRLVVKLIDTYQDTGIIPEHTEFFC